MSKNRALLLGTLAVAAIALSGGKPVAQEKEKSAGGDARVFEMRTYYAAEGKLADLQKRFRDHTTALFQKHGMTNVGYWTPQDDKDGKGTKLVYLLAFPSREAAKKAWADFQADPEWQKARAASEVNGKLVDKVESVFLDPTDYSPIK